MSLEIPFRFKNRSSKVTGFLPDATGVCDGEFFIQQADKAILFKDVDGNLVQIKNIQTGSFITTGQTGSFGGGNVDLSSYVTTGQTGSFITTGQTSSFVTTGQTGVFALAVDTGRFINNAQTGVLGSVIIGGTGTNFLCTGATNSIILGGTFTTGIACNTAYANSIVAACTIVAASTITSSNFIAPLICTDGILSNSNGGSCGSLIISSRSSTIGSTQCAVILNASTSCVCGSAHGSMILGGSSNCVAANRFNSAIIQGCGNTMSVACSIILAGSGITASAPFTAYASNFCVAGGKYYGDGSALTGLATGSFITTGQTGSFGGSVNTSSFVTTGQTGAFALSANTGSFVTTAQTGVFLSNSGNKTLTGSFTAASGFIACNGRYYNDQYYGYVIVGDSTNSITSSSPANSIFGGGNNSISSNQINSTIVGGRYNSISSASSDQSAILGGCYNTISNSAVASVVAGGGTNYICCAFGFIGGGCCNHLRACNSVILGSCRVTGTASFTTYVTNLCSIGGYISVGAIEENITTCTSGASGLINFDVCSAATMYYVNNSTANFYLNLRSNSSTTLNSILEASKTLTVTFLNTNGSTAYPLTGIAIDGTGRSIKWLNGTGSYPAGNTGSIDTYSITAVKTGDNLYTVLGSQGKFV